MLKEHLNKFIIAYLNNIIIYSNSKEEYKEYIIIIIIIIILCLTSDTDPCWAHANYSLYIYKKKTLIKKTP